MRRTLLVAAMLPALIGVGSAGAAEPSIRHFAIEGRQAVADFLGGTGCVRSFADLRGMDGEISTDGGIVGSQLMVFLVKHDVCTHTVLLSAVATVPLAADQFRINRRLTRASLVATCVAFDFVSSRPIPITVALRWAHAGRRQRLEHHTTLRVPHFVVVEDSRLIARRATARGSVVVGTTTFASGRADHAEMAKVLAGAVTIQY